MALTISKTINCFYVMTEFIDSIHWSDNLKDVILQFFEWISKETNERLTLWYYRIQFSISIYCSRSRRWRPYQWKLSFQIVFNELSLLKFWFDFERKFQSCISRLRCTLSRLPIEWVWIFLYQETLLPFYFYF